MSSFAIVRYNHRTYRSGTGSRFKGVCYCPERPLRRWRSTITIQGKTLHIGYFDSEIDAAMAYDYRARREFGEFARTNFDHMEQSKPVLAEPIPG